MTGNKEVLEYKILGSTVRITGDSDTNESALRAINIVQDEIKKIREVNQSLMDLDVAVLAALKIASGKISIEDDYKENVLGLRSSIADALGVIKEVSPGNMGN